MTIQPDYARGYQGRQQVSAGRLFSSMMDIGAGAVLNLSVPPRTDWFSVGANAQTRKAGAGSTIGFTMAAQQQYSGTNPPATSWTDGDTPATAGPVYTTWYSSLSAGGTQVAYTLTFPVGRKPIKIEIYWGCNAAAVQLTATLSDGSAPPITLPQPLNGQTHLTLITAAAASDGQTLTVTFGNYGTTGNNASFYSAAYSDA